MVKKTDEIVKLTDTQHHRLRTEMYLGSRNLHTQTIINWNGKELCAEEVSWTPAAYCAFREILDNSLDEVIGHKHGSKIEVSYDPDTLAFSVSDDGRGIPIDWDENEKMHKATMVLVHPRAGRNFGDRGEIRGLNGVGASATIHCSSVSSVTIHRNNKKFYQRFAEPTDFMPELQCEEPKITRSSPDKSGTLVEFTLSGEVFKHRILPTSFLFAI